MRSQCRGQHEVVQSSQDLLELGRILAAAPRPWQGQDSQEGEGGGRGGSRRIPGPIRKCVEVRMEPYPWCVLGVLCSSVHGLVC